MSTATQLTTIFLLALLAISAFGAILYRNSSKEQRTEFHNRLFIQLLGTVVLGAIVTFSIYTVVHSREAEEKQVQEKRMADENKKRVLGNIKQELSYDMEALANRVDKAFDPGAGRLKSEFWKIAGLSGDLRWVDDPDLLNLIAQAYFEIDVAADWQRRLTDALTGPALTVTLNFADGSHQSVLEFLDPFMRKSSKLASASVAKALARLADF